MGPRVVMAGKAKQPAPRSGALDKQQQQTIRALEQQVAALEGKLSSLLKDLDTRKKFFSSIEP
jgi:uncharacterized protein YceH (UPF0502 family)